MSHPYDPSYPINPPYPNSPYFIPGWTSQNDLPGPPPVPSPQYPVLPADLVLVTVTGTYIDMAGGPVNGTVWFRANSALQDIVSRVNMVPRSIKAPIVNGKLSVSLIATDSNALAQRGSAYWHVTEYIPGGRTFNMIVPQSSPNGVMDLSTIVDAPEFGGTIQVIGVPDGGAPGQILTKDSTNPYDSSWKTLTPSDVGFLSLDAGAPVPDGTPPGTIIVRRA